jgi:hypothetical protein
MMKNITHVKLAVNNPMPAMPQTSETGLLNGPKAQNAKNPFTGTATSK